MPPALTQQQPPKTGKMDAATIDSSGDGCCHSAGNPEQLLARRSTAPVQPLQLPVLQPPKSGWTQDGGVASPTSMLLALLPPLQMLRPTTCRQMSSMPSVPSKPGSLCRKRVVGTLYGPRKGRATFAVQEGPSSEEPLLLLELAVATGQLVKEMASGTVRVLLECQRQPPDAKKANKKKTDQPNQSPPRGLALWEEPAWTMFCNGRRTGCAAPRQCADPDRHVLRAVRAISAGAGVLPPQPVAPAAPSSPPVLEKGKKAVTECCRGGRGTCCGCGDGGNQEIMYMRAKFERVVVSKDSEAFYMMSPNGCKASRPELCVFLQRS